jgi:PAS domain S-box-containing protein
VNTKLNFKNKKQGVVLKTATAAVTEDLLHRLAFDNSLQPNIISTVSSGKIILANSAACQLLGYSKKEMLTKTSSTIFDIKESSFKKMLKQRTSEGHSFAQVTAIKKSGKRIFCEITSAVFMDAHGVKKSITTIGDLSQSILSQKTIDAKKEKIVADNIVIAKSRQKEIDVINEKVVADNIVVAKSKQKLIDSKKEKIVADNIKLSIVINLH